MADRSLRIRRRPRRAPTPPPSPARAETPLLQQMAALTAAAAPVEDPEKIFRSDGLGLADARRQWQSDAWAAVYRVGELAYFVSWRAGSCSRAALVASEIDPDTGLPTGGIADDNTEGQRVADYVHAIAGGPSGQAQFIKRAVECLTVPGEFWVAVLIRNTMRAGRLTKDTVWLAVSRDEIEPARAGGTTRIRLPDGKKHDFNPAVDSLVRVWNPDPRLAYEPNSLIRACLDPLREIVRTTKTIAAAQNSRLATAGILPIPQEADLPKAAPAPTSADKPAGSPAAAGQADPGRDLQQTLVDMASHSLENENTTLGVVPLVIKMPGEHIEKIRLIELAGDIPAEAAAIRDNAIQRLARGLDVSQERITGMGEGNHWSSWQISDEDVQLHVVPPLETVCHAVYEYLIAPLLAREGIDPDRYTLWYDTSRLTQDPDKSDEATSAAEAGVLKIAEQLRFLGLPEDGGYDLSTDEGRAEWAREAIIRDPSRLRALQPLVPELAGVEFPDPPAVQPSGGGSAVDESGAAQQREPQLEPDPQERPALRSVRQ